MHALNSVLAAVRYDYDIRTSMMQRVREGGIGVTRTLKTFHSAGTKGKSQSLCIRVPCSFLHGDARHY